MRRPQGGALERVQALKQRPVPALGDPRGEMHSEVRINADQVSVEGCVMERGHADTVGHRSGSPFGIWQNMGTDQQVSQRESAEGASVSVGRLGSTTEPRLVVTVTSAAKGVFGLNRKVRIVQGYSSDRTHVAVSYVRGGEKNPLLLKAKILNPHGPNSLIDRGGGGAKINQRRLSFEGLIQVPVRGVT